MTWATSGQGPWHVENEQSSSVLSVGIAKDGVVKAIAVSTGDEDEGDYIVAALNAFEASPAPLAEEGGLYAAALDLIADLRAELADRPTAPTHIVVPPAIAASEGSAGA